jgi:hypothetical protein
VRHNCVYNLDWPMHLDALDEKNQLRSEFRAKLSEGKVSPQFCFPLLVGRSWGAGGDYLWRVSQKTNARSFHITSYIGSGTSIDIWFEKGVGVIRERDLHNGTYWEEAKRLLHFAPASTHN